jgi:hypothetical protein
VHPPREQLHGHGFGIGRLNSTLRTPLTAKVLSDDAATLILCRPDADPVRRHELAATGVTVHDVAGGPDGLRIDEVLTLLRSLGVASLLVEGGGRVITSMLRAAAVDRVVVSVSLTIIGAGIEAVGPLGTDLVSQGIRLVNRSAYLVGEDVPVRLRRGQHIRRHVAVDVWRPPASRRRGRRVAHSRSLGSGPCPGLTSEAARFPECQGRPRRRG